MRQLRDILVRFLGCSVAHSGFVSQWHIAAPPHNNAAGKHPNNFGQGGNPFRMNGARQSRRPVLGVPCSARPCGLRRPAAKAVIRVTEEQMGAFLCNCVELQSDQAERLLVMSEQAHAQADLPAPCHGRVC